jgi:hypothetical protein
MAMRMSLTGKGLGSGHQRFGNENVLTRTRTNREKKAVLVSVWLKKVIKRI